MKIDVLLSRSEIQAEGLTDRLALIIDVWRASSSMITALANGCRSIIPVAEVVMARQLLQRYPPGSTLLAGERNELPIPGFDLSNSPLEYRTDQVKGKRIIFTSSNGAQLFDVARTARSIVVAGFLNSSRISEYILEAQLDVAMLCAGKNAQFGLEDAVCAGMIIRKIQQNSVDQEQLELNDGARAALILYEYYANDLSQMIHHASHGRRLMELGQRNDLLAAIAVDAIPIVPEMKNGELILSDED